MPFHGKHQAAVLTPPARATVLAALDVTAADRAELADLLRTLTRRARFLTDGGMPPPAGITAPPPDSGILGPRVPGEDAVRITLSAGASLFDDRYGLAPPRPAPAAHHARLPRRRPRPGLVPRRPRPPAVRRQHRHRAARPARPHPAHPGRHADPLAARRIHRPAPPHRHPPATSSASRTASPTPTSATPA
ncbi:hypothetical protein GCM10020000_18100 [Streptomyces olivoverticillatus]